MDSHVLQAELFTFRCKNKQDITKSDSQYLNIDKEAEGINQLPSSETFMFINKFKRSEPLRSPSCVSTNVRPYFSGSEGPVKSLSTQLSSKLGQPSSPAVRSTLEYPSCLALGDVDDSDSLDAPQLSRQIRGDPAERVSASTSGMPKSTDQLGRGPANTSLEESSSLVSCHTYRPHAHEGLQTDRSSQLSPSLKNHFYFQGEINLSYSGADPGIHSIGFLE